MPETLVPDDLSQTQLNRAYWFVTHKLGLKRALVIFLIVVSTVTLGFSGYGIVRDVMDAPLRQKEQAESMILRLNPDVSKNLAPQALTLGNTQILVPGGRYDFISEISNPNKDFYGHFMYRFITGDTATPKRSGFILPGETKFIVELGVAMENRPSAAELEISDLRWQRVNRHLIADWPTYAGSRLDFKVDNIAFNQSLELSVGKGVGKTDFTVTNATGYGYYDVRMLVVMYRGPAIAGVNYTVIPQLFPGAVVNGEVTWYQDLGGISQIKVIPEVDITNPSAYLNAR